MSQIFLTIGDQWFSKKNTFVLDKNQDLTIDISKTRYFLTHVHTSYEENDEDDEHGIRYDH